VSVNALKRLAFASRQLIAGEPLLRMGGRISAVGPDFFRAAGLQDVATINSRLVFNTPRGSGFGNVVQITGDEIYVVPFQDTKDLRIGDPVHLHHASSLRPSQCWLGRVVNPLGIPVDGLGNIGIPPQDDDRPDPNGQAIPAMHRERVNDGLKTGIRAIDIFTPMCYGQRLGIFAGSGVGKSTLLGMLAQAQAFDCVVVALVGERGREVREFLEDSIGAEAMCKTVCIVATSDESALMRMTAPELAMQTAEFFRDCGKRVLILLDSVTRYAHALREVGSAAGEPPVARGYPASVFAELPKLLERAGPGHIGSGSITALVSVLVDGDDHNDPIADAIRGILDGHIVLDREIANQGRYPPINLLSSLSRLAPRVWSPEQYKLVLQLKTLIARFEDTRDLRMLGNWRTGEDELLDRAVTTVPLIYTGLIQSPREPLSRDGFADLLAHIKQATAEGQNGQPR
jgi:flagellum-specific ATP synthase